MFLKKTKFQLKKQQQATYPSILIRNIKMKKSHCQKVAKTNLQPEDRETERDRER